MGATGPSGGFDIHNFFNKPPPSPYPPPQYTSHPPYPPNQFPPNPGSFPSMPPQNYQHCAPPQQQGQPLVYHSYMHYHQEHGLRSPAFTSAPYNQQPQGQLLPPGPLPSLQHSSPPLSSLPISCTPQGSGGPNLSAMPLDGARLMALLTTHPGAEATNSEEGSSISGTQPNSNEKPRSSHGSGQDVSVPPPALSPAMPTAPPAPINSSVSARVSSGKQPNGRHLWGEHVVYDIDVRKPGEVQPQLEVSPITVYGSDPMLVVGRQIAVNKKYICYGLRAGTIRILNINTALRALLRGHTQRVTDMAFLAEDVHLLASASADGRIFVRKILEGPAEDGKVLITEQILLAIQVKGDWESCHPLVCWSLQLQDVLKVGVGKFVLSINVIKVQQAAPQGIFVPDEPILCPVENPLEGVLVLGAHHEDVTDLAVSSIPSFRVASASQDGTVHIWGDNMKRPLLSISPHGGEAVSSVAFLSAPQHPDYHVLLTAGPLNRELKLWALRNSPDELPSRSGTGLWQCIQTLEFQSSGALEGKHDNSIFNHLVVASRASLILLANAKKNSIYAVHIEFGLSPASARMNYLAEFSVTMPILSLTVTEETVRETGEGKVQLYCVQTQAIQQYGLDVSQCLPFSPVDASLDSSASSEKRPLPFQQEGTGLASCESGPPNLMDMGLASSSGLSNVTISASSVTIPPRGLAVSSAFGSPVEAGHWEVSNANHVEKSIVMDFSKFIQAPADNAKPISGLPPGTRSSNAPTLEFIHRSEVAPSAGNMKLPASNQYARRSRSRSPTKGPDMLYVPLGSILAKRKSEDTFDIRPETFALATALNMSILDGGHSSSSSNSVEDNVDRQDASSETGSTKSQQGGHQGLHLITPSELMNLAVGSKFPETCSTPNPTVGQEQNAKDGKSQGPKSGPILEGCTALESNVILDNEVLEPHSTAFQNTVLEKDNAVSSSIESPEAAEIAKEHTDNDLTIHHESKSDSGFLPVMYTEEEILQGEMSENIEDTDRSWNLLRGDVNEQLQDLSIRDGVIEAASLPPQLSAVAKGRKNKNKTNVGGVGPASVPLSLKMAIISTSGSKPEGGSSQSVDSAPIPVQPQASPAPVDPILLAQVASMQESLNQLVTMQKEIQKQMTVMVAVPVAKEGKRMEGALGQRMEKLLKAHVDAMWARLAEENVKREKQERERVQQVTALLNNFVSKDMPVALERGFKKEFAAIGPVVAQAVLPPLQKAVSTTVAESFQKGMTDKMLPQLEKSVGAKLEGTVTRQIQTQFQTIGRQALQEALRSCFESTVLPAFERTCRSMFDHVESSFQHGMAEYTQHAQQELLSSHTALASTLQETVASATLLADSLKGEIADGQKKLITLAENASASALCVPPVAKQINSGLPDKVLSLQHLEESLDPTIELTRLLKEHKLEEAFNKALSLSDVAVVSWLCMQMDQVNLFNTVPLPLSQGVLLSLVQQLGCDLGKDTARKLSWIREAALALNPDDPLLAPHMRPFLEQLYQNLHRQVQLTTIPGEQANLRLVIHVVHSLLTSCK